MDEEMKNLIKSARKALNGLILNEDKDFVNALMSNNIEKAEHKQKLNGIKDLIKRMDKIK